MVDSTSEAFFVLYFRRVIVRVSVQVASCDLCQCVVPISRWCIRFVGGL